MSRSNRFRWALLIITNVLLLCMLGLYRSTTAAPAANNEPFANSIEQRAEMIKQLQEINAQLKEQNSMFRAALKALVGDKG